MSPEQPFAVTATEPEKKIEQLILLVSELFEERIGGANLGDVFTIGDDDILAITLSSTGGLEKSSSAVQIMIKSTGGMQTDSTGLSAKLKASGGLASDADGLYVSLTPVLLGTANQITVTDNGDGTFTLSIPSGAIITFANAGIHILDSDDSHDLIITTGSDLTADRNLIINPGDAARTITIDGNPTLDDWFDQAVKAASSPTFAGVIVGTAIYKPSLATVADTGTMTLPTLTANYPGYGALTAAHASDGSISESAEFEVGSDGSVNLIRATANVEANGATAGKLSIGPAVPANPVVITNNTGATLNIMVRFWYK